MAFTGFPPEAVAFYQRLELDNTKDFWTANTDTYLSCVKEPMQALLAALADEFGEPKLFRPYRDVRFSADKSPYKTHQGGYVATASGMGWYVQVSATGLFVAGGWYAASSDQVARYRAAVDDGKAGSTLSDVLGRLSRTGFEVGGEQLKSRPRGIAADHPRLELLRHRTLTAARDHAEPDWLATAQTLGRVRDDWRAIRPLVDWLAEHVGAAAQSRS